MMRTIRVLVAVFFMGPLAGQGLADEIAGEIAGKASSPFEGRDAAFWIVYRGDPADIETMELAFQTEDGTAGEDYVARSGTVRFTVPAPSPTTGSDPIATVKIKTLTDTVGEGAEHFNLRVTVNKDGAAVSSLTVRATINDAWWLAHDTLGGFP